MSKKKGFFSSLFGGKKVNSCCNIEIVEASCNCSCTDKSCNAISIKILGSGCKNCITLTENTKLALSQMNLKANIEKVTDLSAIAKYGVMSTPALIINEEVVSYGKVLKPNEIVKILEKII